MIRIIFPLHRLDAVRVVGVFVEHKAKFNAYTIYLLYLRFTVLYKNSFSSTVEYFHAFKLPYVRALVITRQKHAPYAGTIICHQRLVFIICCRCCRYNTKQ